MTSKPPLKWVLNSSSNQTASLTNLYSNPFFCLNLLQVNPMNFWRFLAFFHKITTTPDNDSAGRKAYPFPVCRASPSATRGSRVVPPMSSTQTMKTAPVSSTSRVNPLGNPWSTPLGMIFSLRLHAKTTLAFRLWTRLACPTSSGTASLLCPPPCPDLNPTFWGVTTGRDSLTQCTLIPWGRNFIHSTSGYLGKLLVRLLATSTEVLSWLLCPAKGETTCF